LVAGALAALREDLDELSKLLSLQLPALVPDLPTRHASLEREVEGALASIAELVALADELRENPRAGRCYQAGTRTLPRGVSWTLAALPVDVAPMFNSGFVADKRALVLTSA